MWSGALDSSDLLLSYFILALAYNHHTDLPSSKHKTYISVCRWRHLEEQSFWQSGKGNEQEPLSQRQQRQSKEPRRVRRKRGQSLYKGKQAYTRYSCTPVLPYIQILLNIHTYTYTYTYTYSYTYTCILIYIHTYTLAHVSCPRNEDKGGCLYLCRDVRFHRGHG